MNTQPYKVAAETLEDETIVNRSRFICSLSPCQSPKQAKAFIDSIRQQYPDASHHCYAFVSSRPDDSQSYGFSDDGEPSGTAGRPMLAVLQGSEIGEICAVVTRYFGGVKLGTGGLQRAYGNSVRQAILKLTTQLKVPLVKVSLACDYQQIKDIEHHIGLHEGEITAQVYAEQVQLKIHIPISQAKPFCQRIKEVTAGRIVPKIHG
ncbi:YigZ family protein [Thalassotalea aquiviva]|uniref:YigZ family protein n=1 Tax=Thalassotalea aquiviva TaxID=3242415 RepID=UPI00352A2D69